MNRTDLINSFIRRREFRSYLEIGIGSLRENFEGVVCESKRGIDPSGAKGQACERIDSDSFFERTKDTFDLIFIDGLHEEAQVDRDIANALCRVNPGGVIILHDCLPPDTWHQRPPCDYLAGENWNGTVWKSALKYFASSEWCCYVVDCDWGCGVIDTAQRSARPREALPVDLDYERDFARLRSYVLDEGRFLTQLYGVAAFYHVAAMGDWKAVVAEQLRLVAAAGLDSLRVSFAGSLDEVGTFRAMAAEANVNALIARRASQLTVYETPALQMIETWAHARPDGEAILYFHTKGVSAPGDPSKRSWRQLMNCEVLTNWREVVPLLDRFDVIGVNWRNCPPIAHFCGNFWWARSDWVRSLAPFAGYYAKPLYPTAWDSGRRLGCEFWISSSRRAPRVLSLVCADEDFCNPAFWSRFSHPALQ